MLAILKLLGCIITRSETVGSERYNNSILKYQYILKLSAGSSSLVAVTRDIAVVISPYFSVERRFTNLLIDEDRLKYDFLVPEYAEPKINGTENVNFVVGS